jgi:hypothetical protein
MEKKVVNGSPVKKSNKEKQNEEKQNEEKQNEENMTEKIVTIKKVKKNKVLPITLSEAKRDTSCNKLLVDISKISSESTEPHIKLLHIIFKHILDAQVKNVIDFFSQISLLKEYSSNVGMSVYYDNDYIKSIVDKYVDQNSDQNKNIIQYLKLVCGIVEIINMNILNNIVYIDKKRISKNRLFNIIEQIVFTQIIPYEINSTEQTFKMNLSSDIDKLKLDIIMKK